MEFCWLAARYATEPFQSHCAVHIEDCEGWWFSSCHSSVALSGGGMDAGVMPCTIFPGGFPIEMVVPRHQ